MTIFGARQSSFCQIYFVSQLFWTQFFTVCFVPLKFFSRNFWERIIVLILRRFGNLNFTYYGNLWQPELVNFGCQSSQKGRVPENKKFIHLLRLFYTLAGAEFQNEVPAKRYDYTLPKYFACRSNGYKISHNIRGCWIGVSKITKFALVTHKFHNQETGLVFLEDCLLLCTKVLQQIIRKGLTT